MQLLLVVQCSVYKTACDEMTHVGECVMTIDQPVGFSADQAFLVIPNPGADTRAIVGVERVDNSTTRVALQEGCIDACLLSGWVQE
jgi:hypothetical protein